ncbi:hypothetical protein HK105_203373 [Polyrhizophydium stewartii]|uniref:Protein SCAI n=1 Tax=Polyrhizophydium stewartii TaxID=2732419 RepID=A0ABR4NBR8_9FUNG|nr:hypothetical protein HK105_007452 [Polyrhizophydium stewartii]
MDVLGTHSGTHSGTYTDLSSVGNPTKVVEEFQLLLQKSHQLFAGLRELPPTGRSWQSHYQRTFEVFTKIWKYQQTHRTILEHKELYGLKRWEIGEIASKIGQLYYHYYLRSSMTGYLYESFVFYEAIRDRMYFKDVLEAKDSVLMVKKLRYYARFIVVCLLLNRTEMVKTLTDELTVLVDEYTSTFKVNDAAEWQLVLTEITTFMETEKRLAPLDYDDSILHFPSRIPISIKPATSNWQDGAAPPPNFKLKEVIVVGNHSNQIKFAELTLDMYRMLQSLEHESAPLPQRPPPTVIPTADSSASKEERELKEKYQMIDRPQEPNPHKYMLFRPTFPQLMLYISTAFKDVGEDSGMLLYLSADGSKLEVETDSYAGGVMMAINNGRFGKDKKSLDEMILTHTLHPHDLIPFTRKPMFLIVDSDNSVAFKSFPKVFDQPLVCLLSPTKFPNSIKDVAQVGGLFTLFLHAPIKAFAFVSDLSVLSPDIWSQCVFHADATEKLIAELIEKDAIIDKSFKRFAQDDFLRNFMVRFILCHAILSHHTAFKESKHLPSSFPAVPQSVLAAPELSARIQELVRIANVASLYSFEDVVMSTGTPAATGTATAFASEATA